MTSPRTTTVPLPPWRLVIGLGLVSLLVDTVSDGAISVGGALLGQLGASAVLVGLVTGGADALALALRLVTGPWADRRRAYWSFTIGGYLMSAVSVPLLATFPLLGGAALGVASVLLLAERTGKAVRAPSKTVLLAEPAAAVGSGKGFGVHKLLDQIGAFAGPLVVAGITAATGHLWAAFLALAVPGALALVLLFWLRSRVPDPTVYRGSSRAGGDGDTPVDEGGAAPVDAGTPGAATSREGGTEGRDFFLFAVFAALTTFGLLGFGVISFHLTDARLVPLASAPLVYALAMAVAAVAAPLTGVLYDRVGPGVLLVVPVLTAFVVPLVLGGTLGAVLLGVVVWGAASGIQDSTVKALVAELVPAQRRGSAYGTFSVFQGGAAMAGSTVAGAMYAHVAALALIVGVLQVVALALLVVVLHGRRVRRDRGAVRPG